MLYQPIFKDPLSQWLSETLSFFVWQGRRVFAMGDGINGPSPGAKTKPDVAQTEYISVSLNLGAHQTHAVGAVKRLYQHVDSVFAPGLAG